MELGISEDDYWNMHPDLWEAHVKAWQDRETRLWRRTARICYAIRPHIPERRWMPARPQTIEEQMAILDAAVIATAGRN